MKRSILFLLLIAAIGVGAQNYQAVYSHRTTLFADSYGGVKSMRIDSVKFNEDSILYPLKNIQKSDGNCYTPYGASWLGSKIIIHKAWNYFLNKNNDTIKIKTDAQLNERWTVYSKSDTWIAGTITKIEQISFLGLTDSVKTIVFNGAVTTSSGVPAIIKKSGTTDFDNKTILLSKYYGLLNTFSFLEIPNPNNRTDHFTGSWDGFKLVGMTNPNVGIQNLTWFDVYDFQVGDEIHTVFNSTQTLGSDMSANIKLKKESIVKYLSRKDYNDSIVYTKEVKQLTNNVDFVHYTSTEVIRQNNKFNIYPDAPIVNDIYCEGYNSMYIGETIGKNTPDISQQLTKGSGTCWREIWYDGCVPIYSYTKGLGGPYYSCWELMDIGDDMSLVYYKKGNTSWGVPLVLTGITQPETKRDNMIYPNPATDKIYVNSELLSEPCTFELLDLKGSVIMRTPISSVQNTVNLSQYDKGLYLYRITTNGVMIKSGKVVKQ